MARAIIIGLVVCLTMLTGSQAIMVACDATTYNKLRETWIRDENTLVRFYDDAGLFFREAFTAPGQPSTPFVKSQKENCGVIMQNGQPAEIVMSFVITAGGSGRYCFKAYVNNYAMFYVETEVSQMRQSSYPAEHCADLMTLSTTTKVMIKNIAPATGPSANPIFPNVDISRYIKSGTYEAEYKRGDPKITSYSCASSAIGISSISVTTNTITLNPCLTDATSYTNPFRKTLYIAGFVNDESLDIVRLANQADGGYMAVAYTESSGKNRYYIMRYSEASFLNELLSTYLTISFMTDMTNSYKQMGYVDAAYILPAERINLMSVKAKSMVCMTDRPCLSGGTCIDKWQNFTCICPPGFSGLTCGDRDSVCMKQVSQELCSNNGQCIDAANGYTCNCSIGYTGVKCERSTACRTTTCQNGGTCYDPQYDGVNNTFCECTSGYTGSACQFRTSCSSTPCKNGATCYDNTQTGTFFCQCPSGYAGQVCDNNNSGGGGLNNPVICMSNADGICQNGGKCVDNKCQCKDFYQGKFCQEMNGWFIGSIVLIVLLAVIFIVTLIVCCFSSARGQTLGGGAQKAPYDPFDSSYTGASSTPGYAANGGAYYAQSNPGYNPARLAITQSPPVSESPFYPISF